MAHRYPHACAKIKAKTLLRQAAPAQRASTAAAYFSLVIYRREMVGHCRSRCFQVDERRHRHGAKNAESGSLFVYTHFCHSCSLLPLLHAYRSLGTSLRKAVSRNGSTSGRAYAGREKRPEWHGPRPTTKLCTGTHKTCVSARSSRTWTT